MNSAVGPSFKVIFAKFRTCESHGQCMGPKKKGNRTNFQFSATSKLTLSTRLDTIASASVGPVQEEENIFFAFSVGLVYCSQDPQVFYSKKNFKIGSHSTIHTFKNYFTTVFSVFSFQPNKRYSNTP